MNDVLLSAIILIWVALLAGCWFGWQLLRQNGRILLRIDELEKRLDEFEFGSGHEVSDESQAAHFKTPDMNDADELDAPDRNGRGSRLKNRSLARSRIKRDGLTAGTPAPPFRLPSLDGRELSLKDFSGRSLLLIFSDPHCGPCNALAPRLERFHREHPQIQMVMISRGDPKENRAKVKEHELTFPVLLQQRWEISRLYAMFATPVAYLIDEAGITAASIAVGLEPIMALMSLITSDPTRDTDRSFLKA